MLTPCRHHRDGWWREYLQVDITHLLLWLSLELRCVYECTCLGRRGEEGVWGVDGGAVRGGVCLCVGACGCRSVCLHVCMEVWVVVCADVWVCVGGGVCVCVWGWRGVRGDVRMGELCMFTCLLNLFHCFYVCKNTFGFSVHVRVRFSFMFFVNFFTKNKWQVTNSPFAVFIVFLHYQNRLSSKLSHFYTNNLLLCVRTK